MWRKLLIWGLLLTLFSCKVVTVPEPTSSIKTDTSMIMMAKTIPDIDTVVVIPDTVPAPPVLPDTLVVIGVGDIMMGTNFPNNNYLPPNAGRNMLDGVKDILQDADLTFGNLEGVLLDSGGNQKYCKNPDVCYIFRSPSHYAFLLKEAGFDVLSTANNHAGDFGDPGRANTLRMLDSADIHYAGFVTHPSVIFEKEGVTYGMAAFAPNTGTVSITDLDYAESLIRNLDTLVDVVIVSFHGGAEGKDHRHVTRQTEIYYGEDRGNVYEFSHRMIDAGADIIFGHGPHVTRAVEVYNNRFIAYSLGNFCTYARFNLRGSNGIAPLIRVYVSPEGEFYEAKVVPIVQIGAGIPQIDSQNRVIQELIDLTSQDFPDSTVTIYEDGRIKNIGNNSN